MMEIEILFKYVDAYGDYTTVMFDKSTHEEYGSTLEPVNAINFMQTSTVEFINGVRDNWGRVEPCN